MIITAGNKLLDAVALPTDWGVAGARPALRARDTMGMPNVCAALFLAKPGAAGKTATKVKSRPKVKAVPPSPSGLSADPLLRLSFDAPAAQQPGAGLTAIHAPC